jgi:hypothetical protein
LPQLGTREYFKHLSLCWRLQDVVCCELLRLGIIRSPNPLGGFYEVVGSVLKLNVPVKQQPIRARFSKRHSHTTGIHDANLSHHPVKLHVRMTANDQSYVERSKDWQEAFFRRQAGENLVVISRRGVTKQRRA